MGASDALIICRVDPPLRIHCNRVVLPTLAQSEAHFFEPYVEGDMAAFLSYLSVKRRDAVWGDDPEVQALCEIYDRPAEIWAYDPQVKF